MIVTTANFIPDKELEILGIVKGNVVQANPAWSFARQLM